MKITGCEILHCNAGWRNFSFLRLNTDDGLTGIAEYNESYGSKGLTGVIEALFEIIKGNDPLTHELVSQNLYAVTRQAPGGLNQQAIAAIENAMLDIKGKALGVPVHQLLGGACRDRLKLYWSHFGTYCMTADGAAAIGRPQLHSLADLTELSVEARERGFHAMKTNILLFGEDPPTYFPGFGRMEGWPALNVDRALIASLRNQLTAMREGAGPDMGIHLDLNFNFKTEGYLRIVRDLNDLGLDWFEIDLYQPRDLARIRNATGTPIASCESLFGLREFRPFLESRAMDVAIIDVPWNGAWQAMKIAAMAEAFEINVAPHNFYGHLSTLMSAHFCAAVPNFRIMEIDIDDVPWRDDLVTSVPEIKDGHLIVPQEPGWGVELNDEAIRAHPPK